MIPPLDHETGLLPFSGEDPYQATLDEVCERFVTNDHRNMLWDAFGWWIAALNRAGFPGALRIGGSFVTSKERPSDIDVAVAISESARPVASKLVRPNAHLWTWQMVGTQDDLTKDWTFVARRLQPMLGLIDAHFSPVGTAAASVLARGWTTEHDDAHNETGVRKGWVEVER